MRVLASAPAKLVLLGEYAVLEGAPALVAAIDRRLHVELQPSGSETWFFETDLEGGRRAEVRWTPEGVQVYPDDGSERWCVPLGIVVDSVLKDAGIRTERPPGCRVRIRSASLFGADGGEKLGLGSSAALVVALTAALRRALRFWGYDILGPEPLNEFRQDLALHHEIQGNRGSGVDVAAAYHGGLRAYSMQDASAQLVDLPHDVVFQVVWTGVSVSTSVFLERVEANREAQADAHRAAIERLADLARAGLEACQSNDADAFLRHVHAYHGAMADLGRLCGIPIVSPAHAELAHLAAREGAVYKPSGAGGGDVGLLFARSAETLGKTGREAEAAGYRLLELNIDSQGVLAERQEGPAS